VRVAYYSPLPPERSGIADYSALLLPALARLIDVDAVRRGRTRPVAADVALYHIGNDPESHGWIVDAVRRRSGVVVLHDFVLHHLVASMTLGRKDAASYVDAMERDAGLAGRLLALGVVDGSVPPLWEARPEDYPLCDVVLDRATGVIVHSRYVEERVRGRGYDGPLWRVPSPAFRLDEVVAERPDGEPVFGAFGFVNATKRLPQLVAAFERFRASHPRARLVVVGAAAPGMRLRLPEGTVREDYVDEERLWALLAGVDVFVSLRSPTMGETSGTAIRAISLSKPLLVSDVGWFSELPDDVALKVSPDEHEVERLADAMTALADPDRRSRMGAASRALAEGEHNVDRVAGLYASALDELTRGATAARRLDEATL